MIWCQYGTDGGARPQYQSRAYLDWLINFDFWGSGAGVCNGVDMSFGKTEGLLISPQLPLIYLMFFSSHDIKILDEKKK